MNKEGILAAFQYRRKYYNTFLPNNKTEDTICTCPSCGFPTLTGRGHYEICTICDWEDDGQD
ncbi:MAG: CPCC family cysteine-rich protein, partial [Bacteroidia bacterium]